MGSKQYGQTVLSAGSPLDEIAGGVALADIDRNDYLRYVEAGRLVAKKAGLEPGASGLLINGRVKFHPLLYALPPPDSASGDFTGEDHEILHEYELAKHVQTVVSAVEDIVRAFAGHDR